jgi:hypothetical protein
MNSNGERFPMMHEDPFRFDRNTKAIAAIKEALAQPEQETTPEDQDFCYCGPSVSLQMVSGGAAPEGYLGKVTLLIDGKYVDYVKAQPEPPILREW